MSDELKIPTLRVDVNLSFFDGHREEVHVHVPKQEAFPASLAARVREIFNDQRQAFFAVRRRKGDSQILIIHKTRIRWVEIEDPTAIAEEDRAGKACPIDISFLHGDKIRGTIYNDLPQGQQRVLDFMNQPAAYFLLERNDKAFLINRVATSRVDDLSDAQ